MKLAHRAGEHVNFFQSFSSRDLRTNFFLHCWSFGPLLDVCVFFYQIKYELTHHFNPSPAVSLYFHLSMGPRTVVAVRNEQQQTRAQETSQGNMKISGSHCPFVGSWLQYATARRFSGSHREKENERWKSEEWGRENWRNMRTRRRRRDGERSREEEGRLRCCLAARDWEILKDRMKSSRRIGNNLKPNKVWFFLWHAMLHVIVSIVLFCSSSVWAEDCLATGDSREVV